MRKRNLSEERETWIMRGAKAVVSLALSVLIGLLFAEVFVGPRVEAQMHDGGEGEDRPHPTPTRLPTRVPTQPGTPTPPPNTTPTPTATPTPMVSPVGTVPCNPFMQSGGITFEEFNERNDIEQEPFKSVILRTYGVEFSALKGGAFSIARVVKQGDGEPGFKAWMSVKCPKRPNHNRVCNGGNVGKRVLSLSGALNTKQVSFKLTFVQPVDSLSFDVVDLDGGEAWSFVASDNNGALISNTTVSKGGYGSGSGNNGATKIKVETNGQQMKSIVISGRKSIKLFGFGFDNFITGMKACGDSPTASTTPNPSSPPSLGSGPGGWGK